MKNKGLYSLFAILPTITLLAASLSSIHSNAQIWFGWDIQNSKSYWYEDGIKQGTYSDPKGVIGDGTIRGREIFDPSTNGWYWLDAKYDGAKATSKEVWMPYIYQDEKDWDDEKIESVAKLSGNMANQVTDFIKQGYGKWVRYDENGKMYKGWYTVEGKDASIYPSQSGNTYYYDPQTGLMAKGEVTIDGTIYTFDTITGALITKTQNDPANWNKRLAFPTEQDMAARNTEKARSPYLAGWMQIDPDTKYTQYSIDFRIDNADLGTYCSIANFRLDFEESSLLSKYDKVDNNGHISGYCGVQLCESPDDKRAILSIWDTYCYDKSGKVTILKPTLEYAEKSYSKYSTEFGNEGEGVHVFADYNWQEGTWYRGLLQIGTSKKTGNSTIMYYLYDIANSKWFHVCTYDLGYSGAKFKGNNCIFLENFNPAYAGSIRNLEVKNAKYYVKGTWNNIEKCDVYKQQENTYGSYNFGSDANSLWMITTGVKGINEKPSEMIHVPTDNYNNPY